MIELYIKEIIDDGVSSKQKDWEKVAPITVLELVRIPGLGPKTASVLFHSHGIDSLASLREAESSGILDSVPGMGPKLRQAIHEYLRENV